ncbi:MAG: glycosyltransferase [Chitinophagaceae bacterium]|nr:glycosyltransferase [Chitinophagaceae bacterium]
MKQGNPLVSIITLSFNNGSRYLNTLNAIKNQTYKNIELFILDDASSDDSASLIENWIKNNSYECMFIKHEKNKGICASLNELLPLTKGEFVTFIGDDEMFPNKIEEDVKFMILNPEFGFCHSAIIAHFLKTGKEIELRSRTSSDFFHDFLSWNIIVYTPTLFFRRIVFDKVGYYDENYIFEDYDMILRASYEFKVGYRDVVSVRYIRTGNSISNEMADQLRRDALSITKKWSFLKRYKFYLNRRYLSIFYDMVKYDKKGSLKFIPRALRCFPDKRLFGAIYRLLFVWK